MTNNPRSRSFAELVAIQAEEERARWETRDSFHDGKGDVTLMRGHYGAWHMEWTGAGGDCYVTVFGGPQADAGPRLLRRAQERSVACDPFRADRTFLRF
jgi:hypothetical protein